MKSLWQCSGELWNKIETKLPHAVVYLDNTCAELLHWNGGMQRFLSAGAQDVRELSSFESGTSSQPKGVFILSTPIYDVGGQIIKDIIRASHFQYVVVVSTIGSHVHLYSKSGSMDGDEQSIMEVFEDKLLEWMGNMNYTAEVMIVPLFTAEITPNFFVTPAFSTLFPLLDEDFRCVVNLYNTVKCTHASERKKYEDPKDVENVHLPNKFSLRLKMFVSSLNGLLDRLDVREDIYYIGHTSRFVANKLDLYPPARNRRKVAKEKASIVFIDRTVDLVSPSGHNYDCLLDKIRNILPGLPGHYNDNMVDMSSLCSLHSEGDKTVVAPGSLARSNEASPQASILTSLVNLKVKEGLMEINRQLVEAASTKKLPVKLSGKPGRITPQQLYNTLELFRMLNLDDVLGLLIFSYSLFGVEFDQEEESQLKKTFMEAVLQEKDNLPPQLKTIASNWSKEDVISKTSVMTLTEEIWCRLESIGSSREDFDKYSSILKKGDVMNPSDYKPLLKQIIEDILDPSKPELPDIKQKQSGMKDLLKSGFGLFMTVSKPRPSDHPLLILFVIGGITASEVKQIQDVVQKSKTSVQVLIGSTILARTEDMILTSLSTNNFDKDTS